MNGTYEQRRLDAAALVGRFVPGYRVVRKKDRWYHRAIGWLLARVGNPEYMESYWTTLGSETAEPTKVDRGAEENSWQVLLHEGWHAIQAKYWTLPVFALAYLVPPIFNRLRAQIEWSAYRVSMACEYWYRRGALRDDYVADFLVPQFVTGAYLWMWPFKSSVRNWAAEWLGRLVRNDLYGGTYGRYLRACRGLAERYAAEDRISR